MNGFNGRGAKFALAILACLMIAIPQSAASSPGAFVKTVYDEGPEAVVGIAPACPGAPLLAGGHPNGSGWIIWIGQHSENVVTSSNSANNNGVEADYFISWEMGAATLNNGADEYVAGLALQFPTVHRDVVIGDTKQGPLAQAGCKYVGTGPVGAFKYVVQGGAMGISGTDTCGWSTSISITAGIEVGVTGASGYTEATLGASVQCSDSTTFDSEVIFGTEGTWPQPSG